MGRRDAGNGDGDGTGGYFFESVGEEVMFKRLYLFKFSSSPHIVSESLPDEKKETYEIISSDSLHFLTCTNNVNVDKGFIKYFLQISDFGENNVLPNNCQKDMRSQVS